MESNLFPRGTTLVRTTTIKTQEFWQTVAITAKPFPFIIPGICMIPE